MSLDKIYDNIKRYGYHSYIVLPGVCPRYSYTIGLSNIFGFELILGGMCNFDAPDIANIFSRINLFLKENVFTPNDSIALEYGSFSLRDADSSWLEFAAFGIVDYYKSKEIKLMQIYNMDFSGVDDPDMSYAVHSKINGAWRYLKDDWNYEIKETSEVLLDRGAIRGEEIKSISRYENDYWEMFSDTRFEFDGENAKILPISIILELYPYLEFATDMEIDTLVYI